MGADIYIAPATHRHAAELAPRMRAADAAEVLASGGYSPLEALTESIEASIYARALLVDDAVAAIYGVMTTPEDGLGVAWLLTGDLVERYPKAFLRACRRELGTLRYICPRLVNAIDARYAAALRWARWLGFTVRPAEPLGVAGLPFHRIAMGGE